MNLTDRMETGRLSIYYTALLYKSMSKDRNSRFECFCGSNRLFLSKNGRQNRLLIQAMHLFVFFFDLDKTFLRCPVLVGGRQNSFIRNTDLLRA